jgi:type IV secretory pathway VirB3-like protein
MMIIGIPMMAFASLVSSMVMTVVYSFATIYTMVGCTLAVLAYAGFFGEITFPEKKKKEKKEKKAAEDAPAAE